MYSVFSVEPCELSSRHVEGRTDYKRVAASDLLERKHVTLLCLGRGGTWHLASGQSSFVGPTLNWYAEPLQFLDITYLG